MVKLNVQLSDIFNYIASSRPIKEGEAVYKAGHITLCGVIKKTDIYVIVGWCLQTSNLSAAPHKIEIKLKASACDWEATCTCKAGLGGKCKHVVGVLLYANRSDDLEDLSCTDLEQKWGNIGSKASSAQEYNKAIPMANFCHPVITKQKLEPTGNMKDVEAENFLILKDCSPEVALAKFISGRNTVESDDIELNKFLEYKDIEHLLSKSILEPCLDVTEEEKTKFYIENAENVDEKFVYLKTRGQTGEFWLNCRRHRFTGSNCYNIFTYAQNTSPNWESKFKSVFKHFSGNIATQYGKQEEGNARTAYSNLYGRSVKECGFIINPKYPWLGFSPDGISDNGSLIEIKCPVH